MLLTTQEAAAWLGLSPATLKKYRVAGGGPPFHKLGRAVRYDVADLRDWANARRRNHSQGYDPFTGEGFNDADSAPWA